MKESFLGYYQPSEDELANLWQECVFILDTNVLLDLYRYPKETREDLLNILKAVSERLWIPYQVALEYQENRLTVIRSQIEMFHTVKETLAENQKALRQKLGELQLKKRHSLIDPSDFLDKVADLFDGFCEQLEGLKQAQADVHHEDELRDEIDSLFSGKTGGRPSQEELDEIYEEGKVRYDQNRPPGYKDIDKEKRPESGDEPAVYLYGGLTVERKYGDLILWKQIIKKAQANSDFKHIVFVTDDTSDDWWWKAKRSGSRKLEIIGPRPELVAEIMSEGNVSSFYMYQSDTFMLDAEKYLGIQVREESVEQVRDVKRISTRRMPRAPILREYEIAEYAVLHWLKDSYPDAKITRNQPAFPDFIRTNEEGGRVGYEVKLIRHIASARSILREAAYRGYYEVSEGNFDELVIVFVFDEETNEIWLDQEAEYPQLQIPKGVSLITGVIEFDDKTDDESARFVKNPSRF